jgi:hypothetical protein
LLGDTLLLTPLLAKLQRVAQQQTMREENALYRRRWAAQWLEHEARNGPREDADTPGQSAHWVIGTLVPSVIRLLAGSRLEVALPMQSLQRHSCR